LLERCVEEGVLFGLDSCIAVVKEISYHCKILRGSLRAPRDVDGDEERRWGHNVSWDVVLRQNARREPRRVHTWLEPFPRCGLKSRRLFARPLNRARHVIHRLSIFRDRTLKSVEATRPACFCQNSGTACWSFRRITAPQDLGKGAPTETHAKKRCVIDFHSTDLQ
jgi:hypothetical protein